MSDAAGSVLTRVAQGEADAMRQCVDRYGGLVWTLARRYCRVDADAEDAVQEVFLELWKHAARFDDRIASETTFVAMICRRRLIDYQRRQKTRPAVVGASEQTLSEKPSPQRSTAEQGDPAQQFALDDEAQRARRAMQQLSDDQQQVLELALNDCLTQTEISERLKMPLGTVKTHARRGLQQLRKLMDQSPQDSSLREPAR